MCGELSGVLYHKNKTYWDSGAVSSCSESSSSKFTLLTRAVKSEDTNNRITNIDITLICKRYNIKTQIAIDKIYEECK